MNILKDETKDSLRLAWLSFRESLYTFAPWQRVVLVGGLIMIIPAYWILRGSAQSLYTYSFTKKLSRVSAAAQNASPLVVGKVTILPVDKSGFGAIAKVQNQNLTYAATLANFRAKFLDSSGVVAYQTSGQIFVAPGKNTYIVVPRFNPEVTPQTGIIQILNTRWQQKLQLPEVDLSAPMPVTFPDKNGSRMEGVVINASPYKLAAARLILILENSQGQTIAASERYEYALKAGERRAYVLGFKDIPPSSIARIIPFVETNLSDVTNLQNPEEKLLPADSNKTVR